MNESKQMGKHTIQCFRCDAYHTCAFNMACVGACECDRTPFPSRPVDGQPSFKEPPTFDIFSTILPQ